MNNCIVSRVERLIFLLNTLNLFFTHSNRFCFKMRSCLTTEIHSEWSHLYLTWKGRKLLTLFSSFDAEHSNKIRWRGQFLIYDATATRAMLISFFRFLCAGRDLDQVINFLESHLPFMQNYEFIHKYFSGFSILHARRKREKDQNFASCIWTRAIVINLLTAV